MMKKIFLTLLFFTASLSAQNKEPWQEWLDWFPSSPLGVKLKVSGPVSSVTSLTLAGETLSVNGSDDCDQVGDETEMLVQLKPFQRYELQITGSQWKNAEITFLPKINAQLLKGAKFGSIPKPIHILVNGVDAIYTTNIVSVSNSTCGNNTYTAAIQVQPERGFRPAFLLATESKWEEIPDDGINFAPGEGTTPKIGPGVDEDAWKGAMRWGVSMGKLASGRSAGLIRWFETQITSNSWSPKSLIYYARTTNQNEMDVITNLDGSLRQIKALQCLADIVSTNYSTAIRFYYRSQVGTQTNGVYPISGSPYVTWKIESGTGAYTTNLIHIIEERPNVVTNLSIFSYDATNKWSLQTGDGSVAKVESRILNITGQSRSEDVKINYVNSTNLAYFAVEQYAKFPWGWELTNVVTNPGEYGLTNSFEYETNTSSIIYGQLSVKRAPGGYWEKTLQDEDQIFMLNLWANHIVLKPWMSNPSSPDQANITNSLIQANIWSPDQRVSTEYYLPNYFDETRMLNQYSYFDWSGDGIRMINESGLVSTMRGAHEAACSTTYMLVSPDTSLNGLVIGENTEVYYPGYEKSEQGVRPPKAYEYSLGSYTNGTFIESATGTDMMETSYTTYYPEVEEADAETSGYAPLVPNSYWQTKHSIYMHLIPNYTVQEVSYYQKGVKSETTKSILESWDGDTNFVWGLVNKTFYEYDAQGHLTNTYTLDEGIVNKPRIVADASWTIAGGGISTFKQEETDQTGLRTLYAYDRLNRITNIVQVGTTNASLPGNIVTSLSYDAFGRTVASVISGQTGSALYENFQYDQAGRMLEHTSTNGVQEFYLYSSDARTTTNTINGITRITTKYDDGRLRRVYGTGVVETNYNYYTTPDPFLFLPSTYVSNWREELVGPTNAPRWTIIGLDRGGNMALTVTPTTQTNVYATNYFAWRRGYHYSTVYTCNGSDGSIKLKSVLSYPGCFGLPRATGTNQGDWYGPSFYLFEDGYSGSRMTRTIECFEKGLDGWYQVQTNLSFIYDGDATPTVAHVRKDRLSGFANTNIVSEVYEANYDEDFTVTEQTLDRSTTTLTEVIQYPTSTFAETNTYVNGYLYKYSSKSIPYEGTLKYDALGRLTQNTYPSGYKESQSYDEYGNVVSNTDKAGNVTSYLFYATNHPSAGKMYKSTDALGKSTFYEYNSLGLPTRQWGDATYPVERLYDAYGDMVEMHTFSGGSAWNGSSWPVTTGATNKTVWAYFPANGWLLSKTDHNGNAVTNDFYPNGEIKLVTNARGSAIRYTKNEFGEPVKVDYIDGITNTVVIETYNRLGLPLNVSSPFEETTFVYDERGRQTEEQGSNFSWEKSFDKNLGLQEIRLLFGGNIVTQKLSYDALGRLFSVSNAMSRVVYEYGLKNNLNTKMSFYSDTNNVQTVTKAYLNDEYLSEMLTLQGSATITKERYKRDLLGRIIRVEKDDGFWDYGYDSKDQVVSAKKSWPDFQLVAGQQFKYSYDNIGNRESSMSGGDQDGLGLSSTVYNANGLNQYTSIIYPQEEQLLGVARGGGSVLSVNGKTNIYRKGEYFWTRQTVTNTANSLYKEDIVTLKNGGTTNQVIGFQPIPKTNSTLQYDADGNLTSDSLWKYQWDARNQMVKIQSQDAIPAGHRVQLLFQYDSQGRRTRKQAYLWGTTNYSTTASVDLWLIYDGFKILAEIDNISGNLLRSYTWGLDLSGTLDEPGGIGGLLLLTDHTSGTSENYYYFYDGNGNVAGLTDKDGTIAARYEYSPFGELIRASGPMSRVNPLRWSTKFWDEETGLSYYGYRYYSPALGRWLNRDSIEEDGGLNLFGFVGNNPLNDRDSLGEASDVEQGAALTGAAILGGSSLVVAGGIQSRANAGVALINEMGKFLDAILDSSAEISDEAITLMAYSGILIEGAFHQTDAQTVFANAAQATVGDLIHGSIKKSNSYASELAGLSLDELTRIATGPPDPNDPNKKKKAKQMLKLVKSSKRLLEKIKGKHR